MLRPAKRSPGTVVWHTGISLSPCRAPLSPLALMNRPSLLIDVGRARWQRGEDLERDLRNGGLFVPGAQHALNSQVDVRLRFADGEHCFEAKVVFSDVMGVGLELYVPALERGALLEKVRSEPARADERAPALEAALGTDELDGLDEDDGDEDDDGSLAPPGSKLAELRRKRAELKMSPVHIRLRNLSMAEQLKLAHHGEQQERILLERLYGKTVWEALLRNPRITAPEVGRIARMGSLPKPLLEIIVGNSAWLQIPEIRRALLGNPRLAPEMISRVLRLLPKHELKIVPGQLAYPAAVRDVARRMLKTEG